MNILRIRDMKQNMKSTESHTTIVKLVGIIFGTVCALFLLAFIISAFLIKSRTDMDYEIRTAETRLNNIGANIEATLDNYKDLSRLVMLNEVVMKFFRALSVDAGMINDARFGVMDIMNVSDNLDSVILIRNDYSYMNNGRSIYLFDTDMMRTDEWRNIYLDKRGGAVVSINASNAVARQDGAPLITIGRAVYDINSQKQKGMMLLDFTTGMLDRIIKSQGNSDVCIMTVDGKYLSGKKDLVQYFSPEYASEDIVHEEHGYIFKKRMISAMSVKDTPFVIICETSADSDTVPKEILLSFVLLIVAFLISVGITALSVMRNFTRPILNLTKAMEETKKSGWLKKVDVSMPNNEIGILADSYNGMIEYLNDMFNRLLENEKEIQKAEMRVLQEQIKPHFLYNSLECINCMALEEGAESVQKAIETLGSFYRNSLSKGNREIPMKREISIIKDYLYLQRLRYGDDLADSYDVAEDTVELYVPKLILQPLVENSIYHGIRLKGEEGIIRVSSRIEDGELHLYVYDTGVGMSEEAIAEALAPSVKPDSRKDEALHGFGLRGTIERVRYYSNREDAVQIRSELGEYTEIEMILPIMRKESY